MNFSFIDQLELLTSSETEEEKKQAEYYILESHCCLRGWRGIELPTDSRSLFIGRFLVNWINQHPQG